MKAVRMHAFGTAADVLQYEEIEQPEPRAGEVLVRVWGAGINPVDWVSREIPLPLSFFLVHTSGEHMAELAKLFDSGQLKIHLDATFPLKEAARAHALGEEGHVRGKLVLTMEQ